MTFIIGKEKWFNSVMDVEKLHKNFTSRILFCGMREASWSSGLTFLQNGISLLKVHEMLQMPPKKIYILLFATVTKSSDRWAIFKLDFIKLKHKTSIAFDKASWKRERPTIFVNYNIFQSYHWTSIFLCIWQQVSDFKTPWMSIPECRCLCMFMIS